ncbi:amino acid transporter [Eremomyces bilateralis CBS 781.70]|uniref:Amino acid transporter n=1 Tax=Eremomyces bilateralis CBS 781.70 TaxID=1392243 RepID=A0A6G1FX20_9PEZI|nr:amino acid transporter [Eremomyces bilateralis CBS 781.70]KAF1810169.1 amino acid transporter [Eremomyces bilateralis CBS 781.70]
MARDDPRALRKAEHLTPSSPDDEEARSLLSASDDEDGPVIHRGDTPSPTPSGTVSPPTLDHHLRQSALAQPRPSGTPRTPNRVRFELQMQDAMNGEATSGGANGHVEEAWMDEEDYLSSMGEGRRNSQGQRLPLLTDIEAPSVTVATQVEGEPENYLESARPKSGILSAFTNMANSIIGAGIIGQPYAFRQAGMFTGVFLLVALTITVDWTINLIVVNSKLSGANSFQATVQHCFGRNGLIAISIAQWAFAFGGMLAFCIIVGDTIPHVMMALFPDLPNMTFFWLLTNRRAVIVIFIMGLSYPLSLYRDIAKLAKASTLALISMLVIILTVITQGFRVPSESKGKLSGNLFVNSGIFQAIGVISFAFVCHHNSLLIYGSLKKPTLDRFARVTHYSAGISMVACIVLGLVGFLTFGDKTQANVLNNFPSDNLMVNIARFCFGLNMLTTLPLETFVCREVMTTYYFPDEPFNASRHLIFTTALVFAAMALSLFTCDLGAVFELIGATSACALAYILPPLCYIKLSTRSWRTGAAVICVAFGSCVLVMSIVLALVDIAKGGGSAQTCS